MPDPKHRQAPQHHHAPDSPTAGTPILAMGRQLRHIPRSTTTSTTFSSCFWPTQTPSTASSTATASPSSRPAHYTTSGLVAYGTSNITSNLNHPLFHKHSTPKSHDIRGPLTTNLHSRYRPHRLHQHNPPSQQTILPFGSCQQAATPPCMMTTDDRFHRGNNHISQSMIHGTRTATSYQR